jgi:hypothetical protein
MMPKVRSTALMFTELTWEGEVPDDVEPEDRWIWIKENVDGGDFVADDDFFSGGWEWGTDVEVLEDVD